MASSSTTWPAKDPNPTSISLAFLSGTPPMEPPFFSSSSSSSSSYLDFQQPQQQQQQQGSPSPRTLQGPRPPRLKVDKSSHKIKKPPAWPGAAKHPQPHPPPQPQPQPQPVIIYTVSPKVIRAKPSDFMSLVQRLTGCNASPTAADAALVAASPTAAFPSPGGAPSPVALVAINNAQRLPEHASVHHPSTDDVAAVGAPVLAGILSPTPATLPPVPSHLFSSPAAAQELNSLGFLQEMMSHMSPAAGGSFLHSTLGFSLTPTAPSPGWELSMLNSPQLNVDWFGQFSDL